MIHHCHDMAKIIRCGLYSCCCLNFRSSDCMASIRGAVPVLLPDGAVASNLASILWKGPALTGRFRVEWELYILPPPQAL